VCSYKAFILYGKPMNTGEIFDAVNRDKMFYQASGGGVTVSGGEALLQPHLVHDLFEKCRQAGIHTCIETSGYVAESALRQVLPYTNYILFDLKHLNPEKHFHYTGKPNSLILSNAKIVTESGIETLFRMPLIPGINDDKQNINETADFLHGLGGKVCRIELMPYHRLGKGKYESLDREYLLPHVVSLEPECVELMKKAFEDKGITCTVSR
jgi:pyruvate formate lyase activating enzyme